MCKSVQSPCSSDDEPEYVRGYHLMPAQHAVSSLIQHRLKVARLCDMACVSDRVPCPRITVSRVAPRSDNH